MTLFQPYRCRLMTHAACIASAKGTSRRFLEPPQPKCSTVRRGTHPSLGVQVQQRSEEVARVHARLEAVRRELEARQAAADERDAALSAKKRSAGCSGDQCMG